MKEEDEEMDTLRNRAVKEIQRLGEDFKRHAEVMQENILETAESVKTSVEELEASRQAGGRETPPRAPEPSSAGRRPHRGGSGG
eukprot:6175418-Karenia_brevis.AAC.1